MGKYHSELLMFFNLAFLMQCKYIPVFGAEIIPVFTALLCHIIRIRYKVEKHISIQKNKTSSFSTMWSV